MYFKAAYRLRLSLFIPTWFLFTHTVVGWCWHLKLWVMSASVHETVSAFVRYNLWNSSYGASRELFLLDVQREAESWEWDGGTDKETERVSECTLSACREKHLFCFAFFLLAHRQSVWDLVWSASVRSLQSPSKVACMHTARKQADTVFYEEEQWKLSLERTCIQWETQVCCSMYSMGTSFSWNTYVT